MRRRAVQLSLACALLLAVASIAVAQDAPVPVTRLGDYLEIADDVWVNFLFTTEFNYVTNHNQDFEGDIRDRSATRSNASSLVQSGECDCLYTASQIGAHIRYKRNLRVHVRFRHVNTIDGNAVDSTHDRDGDDPDVQRFAEGESGDLDRDLRINQVHAERAWIDYDIPNTPLTFEVGWRLWLLDQAGVLGDDDPRIGFRLNQGPWEAGFWVVLQNESLRLGLQNDNDNVYYMGGFAYDAKPFRFGLHAAYFRWRFNGATRAQTDNPVTPENEESLGRFGQKHDVVLIMPSVRGRFGLVSFLLQPMVTFGEAERNDAALAGAFAGSNKDLDIFAWAVVGQIQADLGKVRPWFAFAIGSGDDDHTDDDLNGFFHFPQREITLMTVRPEFSVYTRSPSLGARDVHTPARVDLDNGEEFLHTVVGPWNNTIGRDLHGVRTAYSNAGTLWLSPGIRIFPAKSHTLDLWYVYRAVFEEGIIEAEAIENGFGTLNVPPNISKSMTHEVGAMYTWQVNKHFDIRLVGSLLWLGSGGKDIAELQECDGTAHVNNQAPRVPCDGDDVALRGEIRFRAIF